MLTRGRARALVDASATRSRESAFFATYRHGYAPPEWSKDTYRTGGAPCIVLYDDADDERQVQLLATQREPVNIAMQRQYDQAALHELFGYRRSPYRAEMPNIAIYCRCVVRSPVYNGWAHVINVIGAALDHVEQPDYKHFAAMEPGARARALRRRYRCIFRRILHVAIHKSLHIRMSRFGCGAFAQLLYDEETMYATIFAPALRRAIAEVSPRCALPRIEFMGRFPDELAHLDVGEWLLVNAWDPWSFVGNGNAADESLDGYMGRHTDMALRCSPLFNADVRYEAIRSGKQWCRGARA